MNSCTYCKALLPPDLFIIFCPECGATMIDLEYELAKKREENIKRVSMKQQIAWTFIPFLNLVAAYRVKRLYSFLYYTFLALIPFLVAALSPVYPVYFVFYFIGLWLIFCLIMVPFIIKWSSEFNFFYSMLEKLDE